MGTLEELILLVVASHDHGAYGVSIADKYTEYFKKDISLPAVHTALRRLEIKGFLKSTHGGITRERGGRRKRIYTVTAEGFEALSQLRDARETLYSMVNRSI